MNNEKFLQVIKQSFITCLNTDVRSNAKLKVLHGAIAKDLSERLNNEYIIHSLGYKEGQESKIKGRYIDKAVDITINHKNKTIAGIAVKFIMSNYSQNSNNYFENMLGETANIRAAQIPYFQILVVPQTMPYFQKDGRISKWETLSSHHLEKYIKLSQDNIDYYLHTPNKTLVFIIDIPRKDKDLIKTKQDYTNYYLNNDFEITPHENTFNFGNSIICNDYNTFAQKITHSILSI